MGKPLFITFEGIDGCGKSTLIGLFKTYLEEIGVGYTQLAMLGHPEIRAALMNDSFKTMEAIVLLFKAAHMESYHQVRQAHSQNLTVVMDRGPHTFIAYQGYGQGMLDEVARVNKAFSDVPEPDLTFFINLSPDRAEHRLSKRLGKRDNYDLKSQQFKTAVYNGFLEIVRHSPAIVTLDGALTPEALLDHVIAHYHRAQAHVTSFNTHLDKEQHHAELP